MGGKKQSSTQQRERENEAKVGRSRQADVFGLDRGAGGETLGPEGRRSMMSLPNRVIYNYLVYSICLVYKAEGSRQPWIHTHTFTGCILPGWSRNLPIDSEIKAEM